MTRWIVLAVLALAGPVRADSPAPDSGSDAAETTDAAADADHPFDTRAPVRPAEYDPIIDEARIDSLYQRVDELYARAEEMLARLTPPAPER